MSTPLNASLLKGFEILGLFTDEMPEISAATVVARLGMNAATAHRFLVTLERAGAICAASRGSYTLGPAIEEMGRRAEAANPWRRVLQPHLEGLSRQLNESVMACRLSSLGPLCVSVAGAQHAISVTIKRGAVLPLDRSAQGKIWLAEMPPAERARRLAGVPLDPAALDRVRAEGVATNIGENEPDIGAVAVAVRDRAGEMRLSLSAFGLVSRFDAAHVARCREALGAAAAAIGRAL